ncbi:MAG: tRNA dihydrouridine synthase DusB [Pseudomonadota bacterium]
MICIGNHTIDTPTMLAPMAGISDLPFRQLCHKMGAGLCVSEMLASKSNFWDTPKSQQRFHFENVGIKSVQLVGIDPAQMAESARHYTDLGAEIIDINMGCPAKKVCKKAAGSALMKDPELVAEICSRIVNAVPDTPVTLKIRTGWCPESRNALDVAHIAEDSGIQSLVIHGRTRACRFKGHAEYDTITQVKQHVSIPVIANGDITTPEQAQYVLEYTQADGVMIGRGAQGNPWIFNAIKQYLATGTHTPAPSRTEIISTMSQHVSACNDFYGDFLGPKIARKHAIAYFEHWFSTDHALSARQQFNALDTCQQQLTFLSNLQVPVAPHHLTQEDSAA